MQIQSVRVSGSQVDSKRSCVELTLPPLQFISALEEREREEVTGALAMQRGLTLAAMSSKQCPK